MSTHLIACEMLRDEMELAMERTGIAYPTIWLDKGLHKTPESLRAALMDKMSQLEKYDTILLGLAPCGGALDGVSCAHARIAVPRFDDCIRMLLSTEPGLRNAADARSLYYTPQWLESNGHITMERQEYIERYGEKKARKIMRLMLANYKHYRMVETGAYDPAEWEERARADAAELNLEYGTQPGTVRVLEKLLRQEFDEEFLVVGPGEQLTQRMFLDI
ncbi:MAG: DUF1638 domain-containing protein [Clostridia bacterium]|nr:DUF1638 domain-containing protein [Clostridia bacterium]